MVRLPRFRTSWLVATLASAPLLAHGGQYRGPWNAPPTAPPSGPAGPLGPSSGPTTGGRPGVSDGTSWQVWWEFCKDPLLDQLAAPKDLPITGSAEFYLGGTRRQIARDSQRPTTDDRRNRITAALAKALASTNNRDLTTAALIALAKVGLDPDGTTLVELCRARLADGDQEVRETAALALGIGGQPTAFDLLAALVGDTAAGRKAAGGEVPVRTRTFAAWGLGLCASRSGSEPKQRAHDLLLALLRDPELKSRDLRVGLIQGLGLLGQEADPAHKRLIWQTVADLWSYYERDLGKGDQLVQAHVPIAVARLLGRGNGPEHRAARDRLVKTLGSNRSVHDAILQSAAMALGTLCLPPETDPDGAAACQAMLRYYQDGTDQLTRFFCALSLGRIGGTANRTALLGLWRTANRAIERPWLALALGLLARDAARTPGGAVDDEIGSLLLAEFVDHTTVDARSALALAIGLCGYETAAATLLPHLQGPQTHDQLVGYTAVALALLDHRPAADDLVALLAISRRRPFVLQQCAVALGRLGDVRVVPTLLEMLAESESTAAASSIAMGLAMVKDRRSIDPLIAALQDRERPFLAKAFAAAALGGIGDKDPLPWSTRIAVGMNYMATVDTLTNGSTGVLDIL